MTAPSSVKNILVPIDFSDITAVVVEQAALLAGAFDSTIRLLHVAPPDPSFASQKSWPQEVRDVMALELKAEHHEIEKLAAALEERGLRAKAQLTRGSVTEMTLAFAEKTETDLIILGSHPKGAFAELLPHSVVKGVIRKAPCPVLVVPERTGEEKEKRDKKKDRERT